MLVKDKREWLQSTSLVHSSWRPKSQHLLCKKVTVVQSDPSFGAEQLAELIPRAAPSFKKNIKTLAIKGCFRLRGPGLLGGLNEMGPALVGLPNVTKIVASHLRTPDKDLLATPVENGWATGRAATQQIDRLTIREVRLEDLLELASVVQRLPRLRRLHLWSVSWVEPWDSGPNEKCLTGSVRTLTLYYLDSVKLVVVGDVRAQSCRSLRDTTLRAILGRVNARKW